MSAAALLKQTPKLSDAHIDVAMSGNICSCSGYRICCFPYSTLARS